MSASGLRFVIFHDVNDGHWWRLHFASSETR
jgi:hypothetical protein